MEWTQEQLENLYQEVNRRVADDPEFRAKMQDDPKAAVEIIAGRDLPDNVSLKVIEKDGNYAATFVVPDFVQGEITRELSVEEMKQVSAGISFLLIISVCVAAVSTGPCGADVCGGNACGGNVCGGNACGADACGGNACGGNASASGACAGNACAGDACGGNAGCAAYIGAADPCHTFVGCKAYKDVY